MLSSSRPLRVAFLGNFAAKKGSRVFQEVMINLGKKYQWYVFGYVGDKAVYRDIKPALTASSAYADDELAGLLKQHQIDLVMILSIWPETFSKTFFEATRLGYPVLAFKVGYPVECFPDWPLFVDLEAGAQGVISMLESLTPKKLAEYQRQFPMEEFFNRYQTSAAEKYRLVDQFLTD